MSNTSQVLSACDTIHSMNVGHLLLFSSSLLCSESVVVLVQPQGLLPGLLLTKECVLL